MTARRKDAIEIKIEDGKEAVYQDDSFIGTIEKVKSSFRWTNFIGTTGVVSTRRLALLNLGFKELQA